MNPPTFSRRTRRLRAPALAVLVALLAALLPMAGPALAVSPTGNDGLSFDGVDDHVRIAQSATTMSATNSGPAPSSFTVELWFNWTGGGTAAQTSGSPGGLTSVIPLITKGRSESDNPPQDVNYFLGIDTSTAGQPHIAADFEQNGTTGGGIQGANHGVIGNTVLTANTWYHAAATYSQAAGWGLYLNGVSQLTLPAQIQAGFVPNNVNTAPAALGTAYQSSGAESTALGFFQGKMDEVRIWNVARSQANVQATMNREVVRDSGLMVRYSLNDGAGTLAGNSAGFRTGTDADPPSTTNPTTGTLLPASGPTWTGGSPILDPVGPTGAYALSFDGNGDYAAFGRAPQLGLSTFTLEAWINKTGAGIPLATTGSGGAANVLPLISKGRNEADGSNVDMDYILGISQNGADTGKLVADFEDNATGAGHVAMSTTTVSDNAWHHVAATFSPGAGWALYLDGALLTLSNPGAGSGFTPRADSIQHAALGSALQSDGLGNGFFQGQMDEARIWNVARTPAQISGAMNQELSSGTGLVGRWGLNEGTGLGAASSVAPSVLGSLVGNTTWVTGAPALAPPPPLTNPSLQLNGSDGHVRIGTGSGPNPTAYTLELWFKWDGSGGATTSTGSNGVTAYPLITKGRSESDQPSMDVNYFLGIDTSGRLVADFEQAGTTPSGPQGDNHPATSSGPAITPNVWHHGAGTFSAATGWALYLDGAPLTLSPPGTSAGFTPNSTNTSPASIGSAYQSTGVGSQNGAFPGAVDEVRIWDNVRSQAQIQATMNNEIPTATGLVGRWGMNEPSGSTVDDSTPSDNNGTIVGTVTRVEGPVLSPVTPNDPPVMLSVTINEATPRTNDTLTATVTSDDPDDDPVTYTYQWLKNGFAIVGETGATLNMSVGGRGDEGEQISLEVVAHDAFSASAPMESAAVTVGNTAPTLQPGYPSLSNSNPGTNDIVTATAVATDPDTGDTVSYTYDWRVNGTLRETITTTSTTDTFDLSQANHGNTGDTISVTVTPTDGTNAGTPGVANGSVVDALRLPNFSPEETWQTNDRVITIQRVGNAVYLAGLFTQVMDHNGNTATRNRVAAFDALTGDLLPWNPNANGAVWSLDASNDGQTIYLAGAFKKVGGVNHQRVAAVSATGTGAVQAWNPSVDAVVRAITVAPTGTVYIGGNFANVNAVTRTRLAAINGVNGNLLGWNPNADNLVRAIDIDQTGRVIAGGSFQNVGGTAQSRVVVMDPTSGVPQAFAGPRPTDVVTDIAVGDDPNSFYVTFNNVVNAYTSATGARRWTKGGDGNVQGLDVNDEVVYIGGHFHLFDNQNRTYLASLRASDGSLTPWTAHANSVLGVFAVEATSDRAYIGGDFTQVSGDPQAHFAMFVVQDNTSPTRPGQPSGTSNTSSTIDLQWAASTDQGNPTLTYNVYRDALPNPVGSVVSSSTTTVSFTDTGLAPLSTHTYRIQASDGVLTSSFSDPSAPIQVMNGADAAAPVLLSLVMQDMNANGRIDRVVATFDENLAPYTAGNAPWTLTNVPSAGTLSSVSVSGTQATLTITEGAGAQDTAVGTFTIALAANPNGVRDATGNQSSFTTRAPSDGAGPAVINIARSPGSTSGLIQPGDTFTITFSEPLAAGTVPTTTTVSESDPAGAGNDSYEFSAITAGPMLLNSNTYVGADGTVASFANSAVARLNSGRNIKVTVGPTCAGSGCGSLGIGGQALVTYIPAATIQDVIGNAAVGQFTKSLRLF